MESEEGITLPNGSAVCADLDAEGRANWTFEGIFNRAMDGGDGFEIIEREITLSLHRGQSPLVPLRVRTPGRRTQRRNNPHGFRANHAEPKAERTKTEMSSCRPHQGRFPALWVQTLEPARPWRVCRGSRRLGICLVPGFAWPGFKEMGNGFHKRTMTPVSALGISQVSSPPKSILFLLTIRCLPDHPRGCHRVIQEI